jgi:hypothetical protein
MNQTVVCRSKEEFIDKLKTLLEEGIKPDSITTHTPFSVHEAEALLSPKPSGLRYFTLLGASAGLLLSFAFIIFTVFHWPLITGGKPLVSLPAYLIVAFECTILIGAIVSMVGFLILTGLPSRAAISEAADHGNDFVILHGESSDD